jgi:hypothetical protein
MRTFAA